MLSFSRVEAWPRLVTPSHGLLWQVTALKEGRIKKPVVAWVSGTCAKLFKSEVQFGHAGAKSGGQLESAQVIPLTS
jgi:hypothetical protein